MDTNRGGSPTLMTAVDADGRTDADRRLTRARALDEQAWDEIFREIYPRAIRFAARYATEAAAQDAVSEMMTRAVARIDTWSGDAAAFEGWLFGILRNVLHENHRSERRALRRAASQYQRPADDTDAGALAVAEQDELSDAFRLLAPKERELLELRVVAGLSVEEIAVATRRTPGAVRTAQSRALLRLRSILEDRS